MAKGSRRKSQGTSKSGATKRPPRRKKRPKHKKKQCLVLSVISKKGTEKWKHGMAVLKNIVRPALSSLGYDVYRIDEVCRGSRINDKLIRKLREADLVVADVTYENGNVYWELGVRRAWNLPAIQMAKEGTTLPFDISTIDTLQYGETDSVAACEEAKSELRTFVVDLERQESTVPVFQESLGQVGKADWQAFRRWTRKILTDFSLVMLAARQESIQEIYPRSDDTVRGLQELMNPALIRFQDQWYVLEGLAEEIMPGEFPRLFGKVRELLQAATRLSTQLSHLTPSRPILRRIAKEFERLAKKAAATKAVKEKSS